MGYQLIPPPNGRRARVPQQGCHEVRRASAADLSKCVEFEDGSTLGRFQRTVEIDSIHDANEPGTEQHASRERTKGPRSPLPQMAGRARRGLLRLLPSPRPGESAHRVGRSERGPRHLRGAARHHPECRMPGAKVHTPHNIGIQQADRSLEVTPTGRPKERVDHPTLTPQIGVRSRNPSAFDPAPRRRRCDRGQRRHPAQAPSAPKH